ncbi:MAG: ABC transporter substrate-binding protein [bacterium]
MSRRAQAVLLCALPLLCAACSGKRSDQAAPPSTLVIGVSAQPDHLDPLVAGSAFAVDLCDLLFLRLAYYGPPPDYDYAPVLAESWELSDDRKTLTYHLRHDVTWSDGVPTQAKDVAFTFARAKDPSVPYPNRSKLRKIEACEALDDWTVRFRFSEPSWEPVSDTDLHIVPEHLLASVPPADLLTCPFDRSPVGNGRWKLREWVRDERVVLEANDACALGRPVYDRVVFRVIPEETTMRTELLSGGIDLYDRYPNKWYKEDSQRTDLRFVRLSDKGYVYIGWNLKNPLFQDVRVRRALTYATDRQSILDAFRGGFGKVSAIPLYAEHPDYDPNVKPLPFDPAAAARLLDEAGWTKRDPDGVRTKDGRRFEFTYVITSTNEISENIATMTQAEFKKLGIAVKVQPYEWTVYLDRLKKKDFDATILARRGSFIFDPEDLFHSRSISGQYNDVSFGNPVTDSLIDLAKSTPDRKARRAIWWRFFEEFDRLQPVTVLYVSDTSYPVRRDHVARSPMDLRGPFFLLHEWAPEARGR